MPRYFTSVSFHNGKHKGRLMERAITCVIEAPTDRHAMARAADLARRASYRTITGVRASKDN